MRFASVSDSAKQPPCFVSGFQIRQKLANDRQRLFDLQVLQPPSPKYSVHQDLPPPREKQLMNQVFLQFHPKPNSCDKLNLGDAWCGGVIAGLGHRMRRVFNRRAKQHRVAAATHGSV
eukprot:3491550-Amphidinium_carterae.1